MPRPNLLSQSLALYPGAVLWGVQLWLGYGLVNVFCGHGFHPMLHLVPFVFGILTALTILSSYRQWRELQAEAAEGRGHERAQFMAMAGVVANAFFLLLIVIGGIPTFVFDPCVS
jgi:hypothetical protein